MYVETLAQSSLPYLISHYGVAKPLRRDRSSELPASFQRLDHISKGILGVGFHLPGQWKGTVFVFNPILKGSIRGELSFLVGLIRRVAPVINSAYLLSRIRSQAGIMERARVSRGVHDGVIPTFSSGLMRLESIRQAIDNSTGKMKQNIGETIAIFKEGVTSLREAIERMKPLDFHPRQFPEFIAEILRKFQQESNIQARFNCDLTEVSIQYRTCHELVRIVQEALVNVRRHSDAEHVSVEIKKSDGYLEIVIADDGRGFAFIGRVTTDQFNAILRGPKVIQQRVRSLKGKLTIDSTPGVGSRLEIRIPTKPVEIGSPV